MRCDVGPELVDEFYVNLFSVKPVLEPKGPSAYVHSHCCADKSSARSRPRLGGSKRLGDADNLRAPSGVISLERKVGPRRNVSSLSTHQIIMECERQPDRVQRILMHLDFSVE